MKILRKIKSNIRYSVTHFLGKLGFQSIPVTIYIEEDDLRGGRIVKTRVKSVSRKEGERVLKFIYPQLKGYDMVYQMCAPCKGCEIDQPFYDFFNDFNLLESSIWT
jgi:hypothetical protein